MTKTDEIMQQVDNYVSLIIERSSAADSQLAILRAMIDDALKAPDGWQLVPVEPTDEMLDAACISQGGYISTTFKEWADKHSNGIVERIRNYLSGDYKAMLSAAPEYKE
jgi:mannitol-1-phosphate/altronate dehydrogenase